MKNLFDAVDCNGVYAVSCDKYRLNSLEGDDADNAKIFDSSKQSGEHHSGGYFESP